MTSIQLSSATRGPARLVAALAVAAACTGARAQVPRPEFGLFASAYVDSLHRPRVRVTVEIPFHNLVFLKRHDRYTATYQVFLAVYPEDGDDLVGTWVFSGSATVHSYEETKRRALRSRSWRVIDLAPGDYRIHARVVVRRTRITMEREITAHVPDFVAAGMGFGTPEIVYVRPDDLVGFARWDDVRDRVQAQATGDSLGGVFDREPLVRFSLFLDPPAGEPVDARVMWAVRNAAGELVRYGRHAVRITGSDDAWVIGLRVDDWTVGRYRVDLRAVAGDRNATASVDLRVDATRAMLTTGFDDTIAMLRVIYPDDALRALREAPPPRRLAAWRAFWAEHDPDPSTPESEALRTFLDRVEYVLAHFSDIEPGWRTDRGRVYLRYGPPDRVERSPDQLNRGEYEIWRYDETGRTFVFYDMFGLGDFRLVEGDAF